MISKLLKKEKKYLIFSIVSLALTLVLNLAARNNIAFAEWYTTHIYPFFVQVVSRIMSFFPFSVIEVLIYLSVFLLAAAVIAISTKLKKHVLTGKEMTVIIVIRIVSFLSLLLIVSTLTCTINYHRRTFSSYSGLIIEESSVEELTQLCVWLIDTANQLGEEINLDNNGYCKIPEDSGEEAVRSMNSLGEEYPVLSGYYPRPKGVMTSDFLSYQLLLGVYSAFTMEANYNKAAPEYLIPQTMCHELSHLKGFMREDEAEFIGYLACMESDDKEFLYSGTMNALVYSLNALYKVTGSEGYETIYKRISDQNQAQLAYDREYWSKYKGVLSEISGSANDAYLKANNQTDGIMSYGRMVDLLLAYYKNIKDQ